MVRGGWEQRDVVLGSWWYQSAGEGVPVIEDRQTDRLLQSFRFLLQRVADVLI